MRRLWILALLAGAGCAEQAPPATPPGAAPPVADAALVDRLDPALIDRTDVANGLVKAPGRELLLAHCTACHSTALITQNRMTRQRWDDTITWMQETQRLWPIPPADRARILDYLELTQGVDGAAVAAADSPWAAPRYRPNPIW